MDLATTQQSQISLCSPVEIPYYSDARELLGDDDAFRIAFDSFNGMFVAKHAILCIGRDS
jgi:hypothetical protein